MLEMSRMPKVSSAVTSNRVNVSVMDIENSSCSNTYKSKISIEIYFNMADATKTKPTKMRNPSDKYFLLIIGTKIEIILFNRFMIQKVYFCSNFNLICYD